MWYLQWTPQSLLDSAYAVANNGNLLLNNATTLTGLAADATASNYTSITVDRLQTAGLVQAYRLVSASLIISYIGSIDAHSGVLGGAMDISFYDSLLPDTASAQFSVIDDKMWSVNANPYEGLRLIYFPKDYSDFNFLRMNISTQVNNLPTCLRFLAYGQNLPGGSSVRVDLYRNFEAIPTPAVADYVNMDFAKQSPAQNKQDPVTAGKIIAEQNLAVTKNTAEDKQKLMNSINQVSGIETPIVERPMPGYRSLPKKADIDNEIEMEDRALNKSAKGSLWDVAWGLGKKIVGGPVGDLLSFIPGVGPLIKGAKVIGNTIGLF